ncbi:MAG: TPM domain-containing protein [Acidobacteriota bacterium]|nr:TPM domain-containing protein [Acidobacteriota bacterium]
MARAAAILACALALSVNCSALDLDKLKPEGYVSDFAHVVSADSKQALEDYCARVERATGVQMALVTLPTIEGEPIDSVANSLYRKWGIGKKGKDEGLLLLMAIQDHKDRLEIGYGLEPILPDGFDGTVLRSMRPELRLQHYGPAMLTAAEQMGLRIAQAKGVTLDFGLRRPTRAPVAQRSRGIPWPLLIVGALVLLFFLRRGGSGGGGMGGFLTGMLLGNVLGGAGRGGGWGGGGFGGSGGGGGGFGGFGGGDSGGGGASSDW